MPIGAEITDPRAIAHLNMQADSQSAGAGFVPGLDTPDAGLSGPELMAHLQQTDPATAAAIKAMHEGRVPGTSRNMQKLMPLASLAEPGFDATMFQSRQKARNAFSAGGKEYDQIKAYGTAINHAVRLMNHIDALHNSSFLPGIINPITNTVMEQVSPNFQVAKEKFEADRAALAHELAKAFRATGMAESDVLPWLRNFEMNKSPGAMRASVQEALHLLGGRMETTLSGWNQAFQNQPITLDEMLRRVAPQGAVDYRRLLDLDPRTGKPLGGAQGEAPAHGAPAAGPALQNAPAASPGTGGAYPDGTIARNPQTGARIIMQNGQWVPLR